jgi:hypothetical protein
MSRIPCADGCFRGEAQALASRPPARPRPLDPRECGRAQWEPRVTKATVPRGEQTAATRMSGCCSGFCRAPARSLVHDTETTAILLADGVDLANGRPAPGFQPRQLANPELVEQHPDTGLYR